MHHVVSITSQGQLTIPKKIRDAFGLTGKTKAIVEKKGNTIIVKPKHDFWEILGSLQSKIRLSDKQLQKARKQFSIQWPQL